MKHQFALHSARVLSSNWKRATSSQRSLVGYHGRARECLTLTFAANAARPGRLLGLTNARHGGPFATHARALSASHSRTPSCQSHASCTATSGARVCQALENSSLCSSLKVWRFAQMGSPTRTPHSAETCCSSVLDTAPRTSSRQVSALFGPRTTPDSPAFRPLHSSRSSPAFRRNGIMPGLRSFVPTVANCRDRQNSSCATERERLQRARGFAYCPGNSIMARCCACRPGPAVGR